MRDLRRSRLAVSLPPCTRWSKNWTNTFILRYLDTVRLRAQVKKDEAWACVGLVWPFLRHYAHAGRARGRHVCVCSMSSMVPTTSLESFGRFSQTYVAALSISGHCFQDQDYFRQVMKSAHKKILVQFCKHVQSLLKIRFDRKYSKYML